MRLPIDTTGLNFVTAGPPEVAKDYETRAPKVDETGQTVYNVHLFAAGAGSHDTLTVKVSGEPKGLGQFTRVRVRELVANTWQMKERRAKDAPGEHPARHPVRRVRDVCHLVFGALLAARHPPRCRMIARRPATSAEVKAAGTVHRSRVSTNEFGVTKRLDGGRTARHLLSRGGGVLAEKTGSGRPTTAVCPP